FEAYNTALTMEDEYIWHQKIIKIVRQTFGYMIVNDLRYGLLTTYIRTWFFYRQHANPNIIYISLRFISIRLTQIIMPRSLNVYVILKIYLQQTQLLILYQLILKAVMMTLVVMVVKI